MVMDKKLRQHEQYIKTEIDNFERELKNSRSAEASTVIRQRIHGLHRYHQNTVRDLQHERLVHLLVTFFFAGLLLLSAAAQIGVALLAFNDSYQLSILLLAVNLILIITELFYIAHYYKLENGVQRLYQYSKKLYDLSAR